MKKAFTAIFVLSVLFFSCKRSQKEMLMGSWTAVKLENPRVDSFFTNSQKYIDTIGNNGNPATNLKEYGTTNMDSLRKFMQEQFDSSKAIQMRGLLSTKFDFKKDTVILTFPEYTVTCSWLIDKGGDLVLQEIPATGDSAKMNMKIMSLSDKDLKLKIEEKEDVSTVTFRKN